MALWSKKPRKRKTQPTRENTLNTAGQKQRKLFSPEVKLLAVKALEAGLTPVEVSEIVGAGNSSVTAWARAFREGGVESLVRKSTSATTRRICAKLERRIEQERREHPMRVIASIENPTVIRRILEHLGLWLANARSEPRAHSPPVQPVFSDALFSQLPALEEDDFSQAPPSHWES